MDHRLSASPPRPVPSCLLPALLLLAVLLSPGPVGGAEPVEDALAWPAPDRVLQTTGTPVTFPSHSPFTLQDVGAGPDRDPVTDGRATLFMPPEAAPDRPVPAIIMLHGAAGVLGSREMTYARQFAAMGVAALVVDAFDARRDRADDFLERLVEITEIMILADAYSALAYLATMPEIDDRRIVLMGFSYGGMVATYAAFAQVAERFAPDGLRFAGHVAFYAPCIAEFRDNRTSGAPLLMLYGAEDAIVAPDRCRQTAEALTAGGSHVETIVYPGAYHQWDGHSAEPRRAARNLAPCRLVVGRDGAVWDDRTWLPMSNPLTRKAILAYCTSDDGYLVGRNDDVRSRSNRDLGRFLVRVLGLSADTPADPAAPVDPAK